MAMMITMASWTKIQNVPTEMLEFLVLSEATGRFPNWISASIALPRLASAH